LPCSAACSTSSPSGPAAPPPRTARQLAGDLDAIALKALRKEPRERYPSVEALRRDVAAFLEHRPVGARRGTRSYRVRKYVQRHRTAVAASAMLAVSMTGGLVGVGVQARIAAGERDRAREAESRAQAIREFLLNELLEAPAPEPRSAVPSRWPRSSMPPPAASATRSRGSRGRKRTSG
jgi:hypothetical protein